MVDLVPATTSLDLGHKRMSRGVCDKANVAYRVVAARYPGFHPESWWRSRFGLKVVFLEYIKTATSWLE